MELLKTYSLYELTTIVVAIALSIKGVVSFYDWVIGRLNILSRRESKEKKKEQIVNKKISDLNEQINKLSFETNVIKNSLNDIGQKVNILINSDKDAIKSFIVQQHHHFCCEQKWIDNYNLDCLEKRFEHYKEEEGNSFAEDLMKEIRNLPKHPPIQK